MRDVFDHLKFVETMKIKVDCPNWILYAVLTLNMQTIFNSIHDAVIFAVKNGKNDKYLNPDPSTENDDTARATHDAQAPSIGHVCHWSCIVVEIS